MNEHELAELLQDVDALIDADRMVVKAVIEGQREQLAGYLTEFRDKKNKMLKCLGQYGVVEGLDANAKKVLLRAQREFPSDHILAQLSEEYDEDPVFYTLSESEISSLGSDLLYSWISHYEYVRDTFKVNSLVLKTTISKELNLYIREVRNCFSFQQNNAVVSMCRTVLEAAAKDICEKEGFFEKQPENVITINPKIYNQLINAVCEGSLKRRAVGIYYGDACPVVHGDRIINSDEALRVLKKTLDVVQELYTLHENRISALKNENT